MSIKDQRNRNRSWRGRRDDDKKEQMAEHDFAYTKYRGEEEIPTRNFNADDQEKVLDEGRYADEVDYGTNISRFPYGEDIFEPGWNEDAEGYGDRTRRHLSAGSERPYSSV